MWNLLPAHGSLSEVVGAAGVVDMAEGVEMLADSEDVKTIGAMISLMSLDDLESEWYGALAGELSAVVWWPSECRCQCCRCSWMIADELEEMAVDAILRAASTRALSQLAMAKG